jgi:hypothetical protein
LRELGILQPLNDRVFNRHRPASGAAIAFQPRD